MSFRIIPMTADHVPQVAALEQVCFPADPWSGELFRAALENPRVCPLLAQGEDGGALTGFGRGRLSVLMLEVRASNAPAIALYEKHGFAAVGRRKNYYDAPKEDAILMTLEFKHGITAAE